MVPPSPRPVGWVCCIWNLGYALVLGGISLPLSFRLDMSPGCSTLAPEFVTVDLVLFIIFLFGFLRFKVTNKNDIED